MINILDAVNNLIFNNHRESKKKLIRDISNINNHLARYHLGYEGTRLFNRIVTQEGYVPRYGEPDETLSINHPEGIVVHYKQLVKRLNAIIDDHAVDYEMLKDPTTPMYVREIIRDNIQAKTRSR